MSVMQTSRNDQFNGAPRPTLHLPSRPQNLSQPVSTRYPVIKSVTRICVRTPASTPTTNRVIAIDWTLRHASRATIWVLPADCASVAQIVWADGDEPAASKRNFW